MSKTLLIALILIGLVSAAPVVSADPPPGFGKCDVNKEEPVWLENHEGAYWVVVDGTWRPVQCYW